MYPHFTDADISETNNAWIFDQPDGTVFRVLWHAKIISIIANPFILNENQKIALIGAKLIKALEPKINARLEKAGIKSCYLYFCVFGPNTLAGIHNFNKDKEDKFQCVLIDMATLGKEIWINKQHLLNFFGNYIPTAKLLKISHLDSEIVKNIQKGTFVDVNKGVTIKFSSTAQDEKNTKTLLTFDWLHAVEMAYSHLGTKMVKRLLNG